MEHGGGAERLGHGRVEGLRPIEDHEQAAVGAEAAALQVGQQPLTHGRVLGGAFPHAQGVFLAGDIDAQRDDDAVGPHVHAVEQQHGEVELGERGGPPGVELCLRLGHEPPTHRTLARAPGANVRAQRLQASAILARRHAHEHLLNDAPVQRVVPGERPERGQRDLLAVVPDARSAQRHLAPAQDDLTRRMARPRGTPLGLMRIPGSTDRHAVLLQHRLEDFQARRDDQRLQLGLRVDQDIDQRQVPKRRRR